MKPEPQTGFWRGRGKSFACALRGIAVLLRTQMNARIHLLATVLVVAAGFVFRISSGEWVPLAFAIGIVWIAEAVNTAIEALADRITRENDDAIRRAKDVAAGAVLLAAITAAIIGLLILGPHAWAFVRRGF
ncbi:MAG: diacylglycerol kinase family protein [Verrucomicrobia bacterium]|nr:diacylglycerol kinase family protein [Verrucomicrobiota bacterium]